MEIYQYVRIGAVAVAAVVAVTLVAQHPVQILVIGAMAAVYFFAEKFKS